MKLLIIEDDRELAANTRKQLEQAGFVVDTAFTGEEGIFHITEYQYDTIILDINLPDMTGFEICKNIRQINVTTPIITLTARQSLEDKVTGLNLGADEYVNKPIDSRELIARIRALIRRNTNNPNPILTIGDLRINQLERSVTRDGKSIDLKSKEFAVLEYLSLHSNEVVTRTMIMEHVWGSDFETLSNVVDVYIRYLRRKIDLPGKPALIHTIRGGGYSLSDKRQ